jgi:hypothetical protein
LADVRSELGKLGIDVFEAKRGLRPNTREHVLYLKPTSLDEKVCVAAGYIIERPAMKVYYGWRANPDHFLDFHADNVKASNHSNLVAVVKAAKSKFAAGNHGDRGAWIVDQCVNKESAAELAKKLRDIS